MHLFVTLLHVMLCFIMILIILLQPGKDGASVFGGGGSNQQYGPRGQGHILGKATTVVACLFMFTSITLAYYSSESVREGSDIEEVMEDIEEEDDSVGFFTRGTEPDEAEETVSGTSTIDLSSELPPIELGVETEEPATEPSTEASPAAEAAPEASPAPADLPVPASNELAPPPTNP